MAGVVRITITTMDTITLKPREESLFYTYVQSSWIGAITTLSSTPSSDVTLFTAGTNVNADKIFDMIPLADVSVSLGLNSDGSKIYVPLNQQPLVQIIDLLGGTGKIIGNIPTNGDEGTGLNPYEFDIVVTPDDSTAYVTSFNSGILSVLDLKTNTLKTIIRLSPGLASLSVTPDGKTVYVGSFFFWYSYDH